MNINNISLTVSAVSSKQYPASVFPEIAFAGRSNVGKSSMINCLLSRKSFARISSTPGKTATINFYNIDDKMHLVDLPGYGFAAVSKQEIKKWGAMIEEYLNLRGNLGHVILLVDSRHKPTEEDVMMIEWIRNYYEYAIVLATKCDKLSKAELSKNLKLIIETLELKENDVFIPFSAKTGLGRTELWECIAMLINYTDRIVGVDLK